MIPSSTQSLLPLIPGDGCRKRAWNRTSTTCYLEEAGSAQEKSWQLSKYLYSFTTLLLATEFAACLWNDQHKSVSRRQVSYTFSGGYTNEHEGSSNLICPDDHMNFSSGLAPNMNADISLEENTISNAHMPSTSMTLGGSSKQNCLITEDLAAANIGRERDGKAVVSNIWMQSLHRNASAK